MSEFTLPRWRYEPAESSLFVEHRRRLAKQLRPRSLAVVHANDVMPTNGDGMMPFKQNSDLIYLTGIDQEETILVLFPDASEPRHRELLFVRESIEEVVIWEGRKLSVEEVRALSGVQQVHVLSEWDRVMSALMMEAECVYLLSNEHARAANVVETRNEREARKLREAYPLHRVERLAPLMQSLRVRKDAEEIELMKEACRITGDGFRRVLGFVKPGRKEYEVEAEYAHEFLRQGSRGFAYQPIVASGERACILHYLENSQLCQEGDLLLMDVGAEYANYAADMTRVIPVSGRFTARQRTVYESVLRLMRQASALLRPGVTLQEYQKEMVKLVEEELIGLGLLTKEAVKAQDPQKPLHKRYFMHGVSHFLGIDVHDVGAAHLPLEAGMVLTVEPGIYIQEEQIGIRLENNVLIGVDSNRDLMADIPIEVEAIEDAMNF